MAEQEQVKAYARTLASGKVVQVSAHSRTNADAGTAARKIPGRPPLGANGGTFPLGRSLPGVWVMPDPQTAAKVAQARAQQAQLQQTPAAPAPAKSPESLNDLATNPGVPPEVSAYAEKLGGYTQPTAPAKATAASKTTSKALGPGAPASVAAYAKKLGLSASTRELLTRVKTLKWRDPGLITLDK